MSKRKLDSLVAQSTHLTAEEKADSVEPVVKKAMKKTEQVAKKAVIFGKDRVANRDDDFYKDDDDDYLRPPSLLPSVASIVESQKRFAAPPERANWSALIMSQKAANAEAKRQGRTSRAAAVAQFAAWRASLDQGGNSGNGVAAAEKLSDYDLEQYVAIAETGEPKDSRYFDGNHLDTPLQMPMDLFFALATPETIRAAYGANSIRIWHMSHHHCRTTNARLLAELLQEEGEDLAAPIIEKCAFKSLFDDGTRYVDEALFSLAFLASFEDSPAEDGALERALAYTMLLPFDQHRWFRALLERTAQMIQPSDRAAVLVRAACMKPECAALLAQIARRNGWTRGQLDNLVIDNLGVAEQSVALPHASLYGAEVRAQDKMRILRAFDQIGQAGQIAQTAQTD